jgi:GT2 family glycosyltransferase
MTEVTIAIVNWNTKLLLRKCLQSIIEQTKGVDYLIWVVDNNSSDGSVEMIEEEFPEVRLIKNTENVGFAKANNQVLSTCNGKYVLLLNSDTQVIGNAVKELVEFIEKHPEAGAIGCKILNGDGSLQTSCGRFPRSLSIFFGGEFCNTLYRKVFKNTTFFAEQGLTKQDHQYIQEVDFVKGCCMLLRKSVLEKTGLLDENFFMYCEETDLCYRIKQEGMKILYTPAPEVVHLGGQSTIFGEQTVYRSLDSQEFYFRKHFGHSYAYRVRRLVVIGSIIRLPLFITAYLCTIKNKKAFYKNKVKWNVYTLKWSLTKKRQYK